MENILVTRETDKVKCKKRNEEKKRIRFKK